MILGGGKWIRIRILLTIGSAQKTSSSGEIIIIILSLLMHIVIYVKNDSERHIVRNLMILQHLSTLPRSQLWTSSERETNGYSILFIAASLQWIWIVDPAWI